MPRPFQGEIKLDIRDSTPEWPAFLPDRAPEGAPNVLVVLYDDTGLAAWGDVKKVVFDVGNDAYVDLESHLAAAMSRD